MEHMCFNQTGSSSLKLVDKYTYLHLGVVAIEKGAFGSPSTKVANFTLLLLILFSNLLQKEHIMSSRVISCHKGA